MTFGPLIFGDNQFLGVNHSSQQKASVLYERFSETDAIIEILVMAHNEGVRDFMFTAHDRYELVFEEIVRSNPVPEMSFTPCIPYAHKYWERLSKVGLYGLLKSTLGKLPMGGMAALCADLYHLRPRALIAAVIELETMMCKGLPIKGVFLQNLAVDFLLALGMKRVFEDFAYAAETKLGVIPGFITMNHEAAVEVLCDEVGFDRPWICANYNMAGFRMNPSKQSCMQSFQSRKSRNIAMSIFSSAGHDPEAALRFAIDGFGCGVDAVLFGSASHRNIKSNCSQVFAEVGRY